MAHRISVQAYLSFDPLKFSAYSLVDVCKQGRPPQIPCLSASCLLDLPFELVPW